jgi:hypothetical protein
MAWSKHKRGEKFTYDFWEDIIWEENIKIDLKETGYDDMYFFQKL